MDILGAMALVLFVMYFVINRVNRSPQTDDRPILPHDPHASLFDGASFRADTDASAAAPVRVGKIHHSGEEWSKDPDHHHGQEAGESEAGGDNDGDNGGGGNRGDGGDGGGGGD